VKHRSILLVLLVIGNGLSAGRVLAEDRPETAAANYHFIAAFSRYELRVMEMVALPGDGGAPAQRLRIALPPGAHALQGSPGVSRAGEELVLDFAEAGEDQLVSWSYALSLRPGTMVLERTLPFPAARAMVALEDAGPELDVTWPKGARPVTPRATKADDMVASAEDIPEGSSIVITISGVPDLTPRGAPTWLLWIVVAMALTTGLAVVLIPRRELSRE